MTSPVRFPSAPAHQWAVPFSVMALLMASVQLLTVTGVHLHMLLHTRQGQCRLTKAGHQFPVTFRCLQASDGKVSLLPSAHCGGDGMPGQYVALPAPDLGESPGLLSVRQRDTVTENRCHRPDAVVIT